jgi:hypothetical protein
MYSMSNIRAQLSEQLPVAVTTPTPRPSGLLMRRAKELSDEEPTSYNPAESILSHIKKYQETAMLEEGIDTQTVEELEIVRPRTRNEGGDKSKISDQAKGLTSDEAFNQKLAEMEAKYPGLSRPEIFRVIKGESAFNPQAVNPDSGASGLFQFIPKVAKELGTSTEAIREMSPAEQLELYDQYLSKWGYSGKVSLGTMQAAPAFANADPDTVVYKRGSKAWEQNPGWRPQGGGDITVASIDNYYRRQ